MTVSCPDFESLISHAFKQFWMLYDFPDETLVEGDGQATRNLDFSDVTLVTKDGLMVRAHQIVLVASSALFRTILSKNSQPNPIIFLTNVEHKTLRQLLRLIYQGESLMERQDVAIIEETANTLGFSWIRLKMASNNSEDSVPSAEEDDQEVGQISYLDLSMRDGDKSAPAKDAAKNLAFGSPMNEAVNDLKTFEGNSTSADETSQLGVDEFQDENISDCVSSTVFQNTDYDIFTPVCNENLENGNTSLAKSDQEDQRTFVQESDSEKINQKSSQKLQWHESAAVCNQCGKKYNIQKSLGLHIQSVHQKKRFPCDECDHTSTQLGSLKMHKEAAHLLVRYYCDLCDFQAAAKGHMRDHKRFKHENIVFSCDQCQYKGKTSSKLNQHISSRHRQGEKIGCPMCEFRATGHNYLQKHIKSIHEGFTYNCPQCDFTASFQQSVTVHKQRVHEKIVRKCNECDYKTALATSLKRHKESVHQNIRYLCEECDFKTTRKSILVNHQKSH